MDTLSHQSREILKANKDFLGYLEDLKYRYHLREGSMKIEIEEYLEKLPLLSNQFVYVHNIKTGTFYHKGIKTCLGYDVDLLTADFFINAIHMADLPIFFKVSKALLNFVLDNGPDLVPFSSTFQINYRMRKEDGTYIPVLRQSTPLLKNENGKVEAYASICTDIHAISTNTRMKWEVGGPMKEAFHAYLDEGDVEELFSGREKDVLKLLAKGYSSNRIAEQLFISINTVNTHRKKMMKKAGVNKTVDLISYAHENGLIT